MWTEDRWTGGFLEGARLRMLTVIAVPAVNEAWVVHGFLPPA